MQLTRVRFLLDYLMGLQNVLTSLDMSMKGAIENRIKKVCDEIEKELEMPKQES